MDAMGIPPDQVNAAMEAAGGKDGASAGAAKAGATKGVFSAGGGGGGGGK